MDQTMIKLIQAIQWKRGNPVGRVSDFYLFSFVQKLLGEKGVEYHHFIDSKGYV